MKASEWRTDGTVVSRAHETRQRTLGAYKSQPDLIEEHFGIEREISEGGYGRRQIFELVQNGADELLREGRSGRIAIVLTATYLYCANEGTPIDEDGVRAILGAHRSMKRGNEIGRFGLGFKSVLAVTNAPEFFSRSGSFHFDPTRAAQEIREIQPNLTRIPRLRLCYSINPHAAADEDDALRELMGWATTVVRLPLTENGARLLPDDVRTFPAEFLLFSRHVAELTLDDRTSRSRRTVRSVRDGDSVRLIAEHGDETAESEWRLQSTTYRLTDATRAIAGELADRSELPLVWAVPTGSQERGKFWAFFPTEYEMSLRGILNAPWKINADRQNLLKSEFNDELLGTAVNLVLANLGTLATVDDPARHLDFMPGRGREALQWADKYLTDEIWQRSPSYALIPQLDGSLAKASEVLVPAGVVSTDQMTRWASLAGAPATWVHPLALGRERRAKVDRVLSEASVAPRPMIEWLEAAMDGSASASLEALRLVIELQTGDGRNAEPRSAALLAVRNARVLLTSESRLVAPDPNLVFFGSADDPIPAGRSLVHPDLQQLPGAIEVLKSLGIQEMNAAARIGAMLSGAVRRDDEWWEHFWEVVARCDADEIVNAVRPHLRRLCVRTAAGTFEPWLDVLLPGEVVPGDGSRDDAVTIDLVHHHQSRALLDRLGATDAPRLADEVPRSAWWNPYLDDAFSAFEAAQSSPRRPRRDSVDLHGSRTLTSLDVLDRLSDHGKRAMSHAIARLLKSLPTWEIRHSSSTYAPVEVDNPAVWILKRYGLLNTSMGPRRPRDCVSPLLDHLVEILPVASVDEADAELLGLPAEVGDIGADVWSTATAEVAQRCLFGNGEHEAPARLGRVLVLACTNQAPRPQAVQYPLQGHLQAIDLAQLPVTSRSDESRLLQEEGRPHLLVDSQDSARLLADRWGCPPAVIEVTVRPVNESEPISIIDRFPTMALSGIPESAVLVECNEVLLDRPTDEGLATRGVTHFLRADHLYLRDDLDDTEVLSAINERFALGLTKSEIDAIATSRGSDDARRLRDAVHDATDLEQKLLVALGPDALVRTIPSALVTAVRASGNLDDHTIARLAVAVHGVDVLRHNRDALARAGLEPPSQWAGGRTERRWVSALGFPLELAGRRSEGRDPILEVAGRPNAPALHDYQQHIVERVLALVRSRSGRGFISLPTGAGKTRVATHALTLALAAGELNGGPILWVAETDELCEQAVRTWSETWRAEGSAETLTVARLWSRNQLDEPAGPAVVVATIAKLGTLYGDPDYDWLRDPAAVIIDEAHRSLSPTYTDLLRWLGLDGGKDRMPLIGLSATPYRGTSEEETRRLSNRYFNCRLDDLGDDPYGTLQRMGVLAQVEHRVLEGTSVNLTADELRRLDATRLVPSSVEDRIAADTDRNNTIIDSILGLPADVPVLLFAASVAHAELLAGLLTYHGVETRCISGTTSEGSRRHYVGQFRCGEIRALTNYGVLTEGFDAPSIGAVYVARPTYSPNLYQQMIGRGLRGPLNGGKERCLIVNVADNLVEYGERLAFYEFDHVWRGGDA